MDEKKVEIQALGTPFWQIYCLVPGGAPWHTLQTKQTLKYVKKNLRHFERGAKPYDVGKVMTLHLDPVC